MSLSRFTSLVPAGTRGLPGPFRVTMLECLMSSVRVTLEKRHGRRHIWALMLLKGSDIRAKWSLFPGHCKLSLILIFRNSYLTESHLSTLTLFILYFLSYTLQNPIAHQQQGTVKECSILLPF